MSRRGRKSGPTLTAKTCEIGAKVRVTATTGLMAGSVGTIVKGEGSANPTIRFKGGKELSIPARKLQLVAKPQAVTGVKLTYEDPDTGEQKVVDLTEDPLEKLTVKKTKLRRDDADWNF